MAGRRRAATAPGDPHARPPLRCLACRDTGLIPRVAYPEWSPEHRDYRRQPSSSPCHHCPAGQTAVGDSPKGIHLPRPIPARGQRRHWDTTHLLDSRSLDAQETAK